MRHVSSRAGGREPSLPSGRCCIRLNYCRHRRPHHQLPIRLHRERRLNARERVRCTQIAIDGFSLQAAVRVEAHCRKRLEQLCRYITRPALSDERVQLNAAGQVELKLKTPWRRDHGPRTLFMGLMDAEDLALLVEWLDAGRPSQAAWEPAEREQLIRRTRGCRR